jgi:hypothetical protein
MKQVICRLSDELHEKLRKRAFEERTSMAELIRKALKEEFQEPKLSVLSEPSLRKIWDNPADEAYDRL